jgi:hypothetical protein
MLTRTRPVLWGAALITAVTLGLAACGQTGNRQQPGAGPSRPAPTSSHPAPPPKTSPPPAASAAPELAAFVAAAQRADTEIRHAAALINGDIGTTSMRFRPATLAAIRAIDNESVMRAAPAGLPASLLRDVIVVYGDLDSRTAAFNGVEVYGGSGHPVPVGGRDGQSLLRGLHNGAPAAARFNADLAAVRADAQRTPPVTIAAPDSRAAAELALRFDSIENRNGCSEEFGGWAPTQLEPVVWQPSTTQHPTAYEGTINGIRFQAIYHPAQQAWGIIIYAC